MKKILSIALVVVLLAGIAVTGTMAYLSDTDSDVNVMTLGNVYIEQREYQRVVNDDGSFKTDATGTGYVLEAFEQDKPLYPAVIPTNSAEWDWEYGKQVMFEQVGANGGGMQVFVEPNAVDKFVFVANTGKSDAYVRTLIAYEAGSKTLEEWDKVICTSNHFAWDDPVNVGVVTVDDNNYVVLEYVYKGRPDKGYHVNGVLPAGEVTQCSLGQVYMRSVATNEDVEALDGNKNGKYDILVLSQAVQTAGFDSADAALNAAFGDVTVVTAAEWFGGDEFTVPTAVATAEELSAALANGESVYLTEDVVVEKPITISADAKMTINLNGNDITGTFASPVSLITNNGELTIEGEGEIAVTFNGAVNNGVAMNAISNRGKLTINGGKISNTGAGNQIGYAIDNYNGATLTINGGEITASGSTYYDAIRLFCGSNETVVTVNDGKISSIWAQNPSANKATEVKGTVIVNGGEVNTVYYENYTTVKVAEGVTTTVTPYGAGSDKTTSASANGYTVYSFVHE